MDRLLGNIIAIALTLLAFVGLVYAGYNDSQNHKADVVVNDVAQMITSTCARFLQSNNGYANFTTTSVPVMINSDMLPTDMMHDSTIVDPWGNPVTLASTNNASQSVVGFGGGGSKTASRCAKVAIGMKDYVSLDINGQVFTQADLPDQVTAGTACSATATFSVTLQ